MANNTAPVANEKAQGTRNLVEFSFCLKYYSLLLPNLLKNNEEEAVTSLAIPSFPKNSQNLAESKAAPPAPPRGGYSSRKNQMRGTTYKIASFFTFPCARGNSTRKHPFLFPFSA